MKRSLLAVLFLLAAVSVFAAVQLEYHKLYTPQEGMSADEIMRIKYHGKYSLFANDFHQVGEVYYVDPSGYTRKRVWDRSRIVKGTDGIAYKDLIVMTYPAEVKGLSVLTWTYLDPKRDQDVWLWIPSLKKVRKTSASQSDDSFMGSDLTVQEVSTRKFEDETYKLLESKAFAGYKFEHTGEMMYVGKPVFVIEGIPTRPNWYYSKRIMYIDKETGGVILSEYYDRNGKLFKTDFLKWDMIDVGNGMKYPAQTGRECKDLRTGHRTVITMKDTEFDKGISEEKFTEKALSRSRW